MDEKKKRDQKVSKYLQSRKLIKSLNREHEDGLVRSTSRDSYLSLITAN